MIFSSLRSLSRVEIVAMSFSALFPIVFVIAAHFLIVSPFSALTPFMVVCIVAAGIAGYALSNSRFFIKGGSSTMTFVGPILLGAAIAGVFQTYTEYLSFKESVSFDLYLVFAWQFMFIYALCIAFIFFGATWVFAWWNREFFRFGNTLPPLVEDRTSDLVTKWLMASLALITFAIASPYFVFISIAPWSSVLLTFAYVVLLAFFWARSTYSTKDGPRLRGAIFASLFSAVFVGAAQAFFHELYRPCGIFPVREPHTLIPDCGFYVGPQGAEYVIWNTTLYLQLSLMILISSWLLMKVFRFIQRVNLRAYKGK